MNWEQPTYAEIKMDAEIGSYQEDSDPPGERYIEASADVCSSCILPSIAATDAV
jgi:hypothetical protein